MALPYFQSKSTVLSQLQTKWKNLLDPLVINPLTQGSLLTNISLSTTAPTVINHLLGRQMQGWFLTDINGSAHVYRSKPFNNLTLTLTTTANVVVNLWVF